LRFEDLREVNPRLVVCSITAFGDGPLGAGMPGFDALVQAVSGLMSFTGEPDGGPMRYPIAIADMTCGMYAAMGILGALFAREKTGQGQFLDMALFDSQLTWLANAGSSYLNANAEPQRWGNAHPNIVPYQVFRGSDEKYFVVGVGTEGLWRKFVGVLQAEATLGSDARFASNPQRIEHRVQLVSLLQERFGVESRDAWLEKFANAAIPAAPINGVPEALRDPQALARGLIVQIEHPALREVRSIANPVRFSDMPVSYRLPPPMLGEHTAEILQGLGAGS